MKTGLGRGGAEPTNPDVTWDDQKRINRFGQLNLKIEELRDRLKKQKEKLENLNDAAAAVEMVMDDGDILLKFGSVFVESSEDAATAYVERLRQRLLSETDETETEIRDIDQEMVALKGVLYAKFGNSINLETMPQEA